MDALLDPWPWYVAGPLIALVMVLLLFSGRTFGVSSSLRTLCTLGGAGRVAEFFRQDAKAGLWNLVFVAGALGGGALMAILGTRAGHVELAPAAADSVRRLGFDTDGRFGPDALIGGEGLTSVRALLILVVGGFLIGFGSRWAGGCTSGHAITGLSDLQKPSLVAVIGFFAGGLLMTWILMPLVLGGPGA
jgi:hypothetical protein